MIQKLAIVTVNYQNYEVTDDFLQSLGKQTAANFKVFIADLSDKKKEISPHAPQLVIPGENKGYAHGVNIAINQARQSGYSHFVVINNDTIVDQDFVKLACESVDASPMSVIGGKIYYAPGFEYHKKRYVRADLGKVIWYAGGVIDWKNVHTKHKGVDEVDRGQFETQGTTEFVTGCMMLFDDRVLDTVGMFDESYFLYYEDADFCVRAQRRGAKVLYDPRLILWHKNAQSTDGVGSRIHVHYGEKNRLKFGLRYAPVRTKLHLLKNLLTRS